MLAWHTKSSEPQRTTASSSRAPAATARSSAAAKRCAARSSTSSSAAPKTTLAIGNPAGDPETTTTAAPSSSTAPTKTTSSEHHTTTTKTSGGGGGGGGGGSGGGDGGNDVKPANWPTKTQSGNTYEATRATASDPYLLSISEALNNANTPAYNEEHSGDLTYYAQGQGSCGDYYTDDTYTAAVSHILYEAWPGSAAVDTDRSPICGPYVPGRQIINSLGTFSPAVHSDIGSVIIGGDGLANCQSSVGSTGQCHIPLTATITNPANGKTAVVKIVDKCAGCAVGDIDVTITVFKHLSDPSLGRVPVTWKFNHF